MKKFAVFASGSGTNFEAILRKMKEENWDLRHRACRLRQTAGESAGAGRKSRNPVIRFSAEII